MFMRSSIRDLLTVSGMFGGGISPECMTVSSGLLSVWPHGCWYTGLECRRLLLYYVVCLCQSGMSNLPTLLAGVVA